MQLLCHAAEEASNSMRCSAMQCMYVSVNRRGPAGHQSGNKEKERGQKKEGEKSLFVR